MNTNLAVTKHAGKRFRWVIRPAQLIIGLLVLIVAVQYLGFLRWSCLNCSLDEIDIQTGRIRYSYLIFCIPAYRSVRDSALTMVLSEAERQVPARLWRKVNVFSPGLSYSPHYSYHLAAYQVYEIERVWNVQGFTPEERRESARRILNTWQRDGNYFGVEDYIRALKSQATK